MDAQIGEEIRRLELELSELAASLKLKLPEKQESRMLELLLKAEPAFKIAALGVTGIILYVAEKWLARYLDNRYRRVITYDPSEKAELQAAFI